MSLSKSANAVLFNARTFALSKSESVIKKLILYNSKHHYLTFLNLKDMKKLLNPVIAIAILATLMMSCRGKSIFKCGDDIDLGRIELTEDTKSYFPYTGNEKIVLKNAKGEEITLESFNAASKPQEDITNETARLCDEGFLDKQIVFIKTTRLNFGYVNKGKRQMSFSYDAFASGQGESKDKLGVYDYLYLTTTIDSSKGVSGSKYLQIRGDISQLKGQSYSTGISFAADTTIGNKNFKNVFSAKNPYSTVSIAKGKGLIALKVNDELWLVDRVE